MHRLLERQIKKILKQKFEDLPHVFQLFLQDVSEAYQEADRSKDLLERIHQNNIAEIDKFKAKEQEVAISASHLEMLNSFSRFVPKEFLQYLDKDDVREIQLGDAVQKKMTILFADIRGFSSLSEKMSVEDNFKFLNSFLMRMGPCIHQAGGFIDKFIGDAIMALFPTHGADSAVHAALEMRKVLDTYNKHRVAHGYMAIEFGIGLNTGELMLGTVGSDNRLNTTVIGDSVNLASRLEALTVEMGVNILISETVYAELSNPKAFMIRNIGKVQVKGKTEKLQIFEVFDHEDAESIKKKLDMADIFEKAVKTFQEGSFEESMNYFKKCIGIHSTDAVVIKYLQRCRNYIQNPPPSGWQGISVNSKS